MAEGRPFARMRAVLVAGLVASGCGLVCPDQEVLAVDAPDRTYRARTVSRGCGQESALGVMLLDVRARRETVLVDSRYVSEAALVWPSASVLQVTLMVSPEVATTLVKRAVRRVGGVRIEYYAEDARGISGAL